MFREMAFMEMAEKELSRNKETLKEMDRLLHELFDGRLKRQQLVNGMKYMVQENGAGCGFTCINSSWPGCSDFLDEVTSRRILVKGKKIVAENIRRLEDMLRGYGVYDPAAIHRSLGGTYGECEFSRAFINDDIDPRKWLVEDYEKNPSHPENLKYETKQGELTRSKSESIIYDELHNAGIWFRYECRFEIHTRCRMCTYYPDFMILRKRDRRIILWEHFGKMDDPEYHVKTIQKIRDYAACGYYCGLNLIMTQETGEEPFTSREAEETIRIMQQ
jgi:hypothetical protein